MDGDSASLRITLGYFPYKFQETAIRLGMGLVLNDC